MPGAAPKQVWKVTVRADSAFFSSAFIHSLEILSRGYVIKVKIRCSKGIGTAQVWRKVTGQVGIWTADSGSPDQRLEQLTSFGGYADAGKGRSLVCDA